jgi:hypothetical protein
VTWLRENLASTQKPCIIVYAHRPAFSSGAKHGPSVSGKAIFSTLYDAYGTIYLSGHDHEYERYAPQDSSGHLDNIRGVRAFVVGTGGAELYTFGTPDAIAKYVII